MPSLTFISRLTGLPRSYPGQQSVSFKSQFNADDGKVFEVQGDQVSLIGSRLAWTKAEGWFRSSDVIWFTAPVPIGMLVLG